MGTRESQGLGEVGREGGVDGTPIMGVPTVQGWVLMLLLTVGQGGMMRAGSEGLGEETVDRQEAG